MTGRPVAVTAVFRIRSGEEGRFRQAADAAVAATRREEGCLAYDLYESADDSTTFMFAERWRSNADLDGHLEQEHMKAFLAAAAAVLADEIDVRFWRAVP